MGLWRRAANLHADGNTSDVSPGQIVVLGDVLSVAFDHGQKGIRTELLEAPVGAWFDCISIPDDWAEALDSITDAALQPAPAIDTDDIEERMRRNADLVITREEYVSRKRALESELGVGLPEADWDARVLEQAKRLFDGLTALWAKANPKQRAEIVGTMFSEVRVCDQEVVSATLAQPEYVALAATTEAAQAKQDAAGVWRPRTVLGALGQRSPSTVLIRARPEVAMLRELEKRLTTWLGLLGLNPSDRGRLGLAQIRTKATGLAALREEVALRARRGGG